MRGSTAMSVFLPATTLQVQAPYHFRVLRVLEPATEEVLAEVPRAGIEETDAAVARAVAAYPEWRAVAPDERAGMLPTLGWTVFEKQLAAGPV